MGASLEKLTYFQTILPISIAWIEGFAIFLGVFVVAAVGSYNDWQKEKQFLKLQLEGEKDNMVSTTSPFFIVRFLRLWQSEEEKKSRSTTTTFRWVMS